MVERLVGRASGCARGQDGHSFGPRGASEGVYLPAGLTGVARPLGSGAACGASGGRPTQQHRAGACVHACSPVAADDCVNLILKNGWLCFRRPAWPLPPCLDHVVVSTCRQASRGVAAAVGDRRQPGVQRRAHPPRAQGEEYGRPLAVSLLQAHARRLGQGALARVSAVAAGG